MGNCMSSDKKAGNPNEPQGHLPKPGPDGPSSTGYEYGSGSQDNWDDIRKEIEEQLEKNVKDDLDNNPEQLLINFIFMSVQFLKHFENDKQQMILKETEEKKKYNDALREKKKYCLLPGGLPAKSFEYVSLKDDENEGIATPLHGTPILVFYNNIEISDQDVDEEGSQQYADLDNPTYKMGLEPCKKNHGFVKIRCKDDPSKFAKRLSSQRMSLASALSLNSDLDAPDPQVAQRTSSNMVSAAPANPVTTDPVIPVDPPSYQMKKFLESPMSQSRKSFDELHPMGLPKAPLKPGEALRRNSSFKVIDENSDADDDGPISPSDFRSLIEAKAGGPSSLFVSRQQSFPPKQNPVTIPSSRPNNRVPGTVTPNSLSVPPSESSRKGSDGRGGSFSSDYGTILRDTSLPPEEDCTSLINSDCFFHQDVPLFDVDEEDDDGPYPLDPQNIKRIYLSSKQMMENFCKSQFYDVARSIGKGSLTSSARKLPLSASIVCREEEEYGTSGGPVKESMWYFTPTLEVPFFPNEYYVRFKMRQRAKLKHIKTGVTYQWPTDKMVDQIIQKGCNLVPTVVHNSKRKINNADSNLEWEVLFSKAEQYMTRNLHHAKIRVYLFSLLMLKCHFEKFDGLSERHIRHALYWMIEKNPVDWTEENVGDRFMDLWETMKKRLSKQHMPNFFIQHCNMFSTVQHHRLMRAHERVHRLNENPVMFILKCLQRIHSEQDFYPMIDVKKLHHILTMTQEEVLFTISPMLNGMSGGGGQNGVTKTTSVEHLKSAIKNNQKTDNYQKRMELLRLQKEEEARSKSRKRTSTEGSEDTNLKNDINLEEKMKPFDAQRKYLVLKFFFSHFIQMAEKSNQFRHKGQSYLYVQMCDIILKRIQHLQYNIDSDQRGKLETLKTISTSRECFRDYWNMRMGGQNLPEAPEELTVEALTRRLRGLQSQESVDAPSTSSRSTMEQSSQNRTAVQFKAKEDESVSQSHRQENGVATTTIAAEIHSPTSNGVLLRVEPEVVKKKVSIVDPNSITQLNEDDTLTKKKNKLSKKKKKEKKPEFSESIGNKVVDDGMTELERKIQEEYVKVPERKSEKEGGNDKALSASLFEAKSKVKKKSLSFRRNNSTKPALDLDTMWRQEEEKALGLVKGFSPKPEFQPRSITIQTSDGNSSPPSENLSDEETYL